MKNATKPAKLKELAGNPGKRPINTREPEAKGQVEPCPDWFSEDAKEEWHRIIPELQAMGLIGKVDTAVVRAHCLVYGEVIATARSGEPLKAAMLAQLRIGACELGLTPLSRAKLSLPETEKDECDDFFH